MAEMSMNKAIHGAFRRDLTRFLDALGRVADGDRTRAAGLGRAFANFDSELTIHHTGEHEIAWPALQSVGVGTELLAQLDAEHDALAASLAEARQRMATYTSSASAADAEAARAAIVGLQSVIEAHMEHEEAELEPVYLANESGPEMKAMGRKFGKVSPARGGRFFAWVTDGASPDELASIRSQVPGPVLMIIGGIFGRGYCREVASVWRS